MRIPSPKSCARLLSLFLCLLLSATALAQERTLDFFRPATGMLAAGEHHDWHFIAHSGSLISLVARGTSGDLDPRLDVHGVDGALVATNDDVDWPVSRDAVIEALSPGSTGRFRVRVSSVGQGSGAYELTMLEGWSSLAWQADFGNASAWEAGTTAADTLLGEGRAVLVLEPPARSVSITRELELPAKAFGLQADVTEVAGNRGWRIGIVTHWQGAREWARFLVDDQGRWQFLASTREGVRVLRPLAPHPAIRDDESPESLGIINYGDTLEFFFNRKSLGRLANNIPLEHGRIGLYAGSRDTDGGQVTAWFSNLRLTEPARTQSGALLPELLGGDERMSILRHLQRRRLVPGSGQLAMQVPESYVISNRAGVSTLRLGGERQFSRFALGASFVAEHSSNDMAAGCGLALEKDGEWTYTLAWLDNTGSAGLSRLEGGAFAPGPVRSDLQPGQSPRQLLVVADGERIHFYAARRYVGALPAAAPAGTIGIAALSFGNLTSTCRFSDTWVWVWPPEQSE